MSQSFRLSLLGLENCMKRLVPLLLAALLACDGSDATLAQLTRSVDGTWILQSVNASPLPAPNSTGTEILGSSLVAANNAFTLTSVVRAAGSGTAPETKVVSGGVYCGHVGCRPQLLIVFATNNNFDALVDGATLTLTSADGVLVFRRQ
jgi:hypothetical protein